MKQAKPWIEARKARKDELARQERREFEYHLEERRIRSAQSWAEYEAKQAKITDEKIKRTRVTRMTMRYKKLPEISIKKYTRETDLEEQLKMVAIACQLINETRDRPALSGLQPILADLGHYLSPKTKKIVANTNNINDINKI